MDCQDFAICWGSLQSAKCWHKLHAPGMMFLDRPVKVLHLSFPVNPSKSAIGISVFPAVEENQDLGRGCAVASLHWSMETCLKQMPKTKFTTTATTDATNNGVHRQNRIHHYKNHYKQMWRCLLPNWSMTSEEARLYQLVHGSMIPLDACLQRARIARKPSSFAKLLPQEEKWCDQLHAWRADPLKIELSK